MTTNERPPMVSEHRLDVKGWHTWPPRPHRCAGCGRAFDWIEGRSFWYGSYMDIEQGKPIKKYCGRRDCDASATAARIPTLPEGEEADE